MGYDKSLWKQVCYYTLLVGNWMLHNNDWGVSVEGCHMHWVLVFLLMAFPDQS